jgi:hypothetical protein
MNKLNLKLQPKEYSPNLQPKEYNPILNPNMRPKGSWAENCADKPGAGMHVVLSTKYGGGKGIYFDVSKRAKAALQALGCSVYNPNTDNTLGDDGWLKSFNKNLDSVAEKEGFVYQLQQGKARERSQMQEAEEMNAQNWKGGVPKIGAYIPDDGHYGDGIYDVDTVRRDAWAAIRCARRQWAQGVRLEVELAEELEGYSTNFWPLYTQGPPHLIGTQMCPHDRYTGTPASNWRPSELRAPLT